jgi:hypothetical protein
MIEWMRRQARFACRRVLQKFYCYALTKTERESRRSLDMKHCETSSIDKNRKLSDVGKRTGDSRLCISYSKCLVRLGILDRMNLRLPAATVSVAFAATNRDIAIYSEPRSVVIMVCWTEINDACLDVYRRVAAGGRKLQCSRCERGIVK